MIVDDDTELRALTAEVLEAAGHRIVQAENGQKALDLLRAGTAPDLILLDMMMPVLSGAELIEIMQEDPVLAALPVVVVSAFADTGAAPGVKRFVRKPVSASALRALVAEYAS